jgi:hypothetical protein
MKDLMLAVIERSLTGAEALSQAQRADLYDGVAALCGGQLPEVAAHAAATAAALREAEQRQLVFAALLRPNPNAP